PGGLCVDLGSARILFGAAPCLRRAGGVGGGEHLQERDLSPVWPDHCGDWDGYDHRNAPPDVWYLRAPGRDQVPGRRGWRVWDRRTAAGRRREYHDQGRGGRTDQLGECL